MVGFLHYQFGGLIFGEAHAWRGLFLEFYGIRSLHSFLVKLNVKRAFFGLPLK